MEQIEALEAQLHAINEEEAAAHASFKERKQEITRQIREIEAQNKVAALADTLTEEDKAALLQHLSIGQEG